MGGYVELTMEQIAADFCAANPGKTVIVTSPARQGREVILDPSGCLTVNQQETVETPSISIYNYK